MYLESYCLKLVKRGCSETFSGKLFYKLFSDWHMLDTLRHVLYFSIDKHEKGQNSSFNEESDKRKLENFLLVINFRCVCFFL